MTNWIQDKYQRFTLYMLDHFSILVSFWAMATVVAAIMSVIASTLIKPNSSTIVSLTVITLLVPLYFSYSQFCKERKGKYKEYTTIQMSYAGNVAFRIFNSTTFFLFLFFDCNRYYWLGDKAIFICSVSFDVFYASFYLFMCCYTRRREPPAYSKMSFNPA